VKESDFRNDPEVIAFEALRPDDLDVDGIKVSNQ
jgi:hypothetical protein